LVKQVCWKAIIPVKSVPVVIAAIASPTIIRAMLLIAWTLRVLTPMVFLASSVVIFPTMIVAVIVFTTLVGIASTLVASSIVVTVLVVVGIAHVSFRKCLVCPEREGCDDGRSRSSWIVRHNTGGHGSARDGEH